ncbi:venom prothrombin activator nigrarin-D-like isoform X2 [Stegodyphus dumicola]|nr:venom prothrombin activator nigrarin-D-like isoform X2 [Stegodyphus dumicola]
MKAIIAWKCPQTFTVPNGKVMFQSRSGVTAVFTCDSGFTLRGTNVSHCQTDGHWSASAPTCVPNGQKSSHAEIENIVLNPGHSVNISCFPNGQSHVFWTTNGSISGMIFYESNALVLSTQVKGVHICFSYNSRKVVVLKAVRVVISNEVSPDPISRTCEFTFKNKTTSLTSRTGTKVIISCDVDSRTAVTSWFKNGKEITEENRSPLKSYYVIPNLQLSDEGNYTCVVSEKYCSKTKSVVVKVQNSNESSFSYMCGQPVANNTRRNKRVIDGSRASPLSAPWMGMLSIDREPPFCGCTLISDSWIITAAHCFKSVNNGVTSVMSPEEIRRKVRVKFGKQQRRQIEKDEVVRSMRNLIIHPKYKPVSSLQNVAIEHDIALGKLNEPVTFQPTVLPICLPPLGFMANLPSNILGVVTGWGRVSVRDSVMALTLQEAYLPLVNNSSCQQSTNYVITDNMLCAGYAESYRPDTCFGDSGGPFVLQKSDSWYLAGVVSWGEGCSSPKKFGIYTKVENYVPWIQSVLVENS